MQVGESPISKCNSLTIHKLLLRNNQSLIAFVILIVTLLSTTTARTTRAIEYTWSKGPWGRCEGTSCGEGGTQLRAVTCVYGASKWPIVDFKCSGLEKPNDQRPCFKVCQKHRNHFRWKTTVWGLCELLSSKPHKPSKLIPDMCGLGVIRSGIQKRNVSCVSIENDDKIMESYVCERFTAPPTAVQPCDIPCPQNCVLSVFGDWSQCSATCGNGTQYRTRYVLVTSRFGGKECPALSETRVCPGLPACRNDLDDPTFRKRLLNSESQHTLKFGAWSDCQPAKADLSNIQKNRKQSRRILQRINMNLIGQREQHLTCLDAAGQPMGDSVIVRETCSVNQHCELSDWSEWSVCYAKCGPMGERFRTRRLLTLPSGGAECNILKEVENCGVDENYIRPCSLYTWVTGGWSSCDVIDNNSTCGGGIQTRDVYCIVRDEFTLHQASTASQIGSENGTVEWAKMQPVADANCEQTYRPKIWQECDVACPSDCRLSQWSDWSDCAPEFCKDDPWPMTDSRGFEVAGRKVINGYKRRVRTVIGGNTTKDTNCQHTTEVMPCDSPRCAQWHINKVLPCEAKNNICGVGLRKQELECRNLWGQIVSDEVCLSDDSLPRYPPTLICNVPCGSDCVISDWSTWSPCTHPCKKGRRESGMQHRYREILANAGPGGQRCPSEERLRQSQPCNQHRCSLYYWDISNWSDCLIKGTVAPERPSGVHKSDLFMSDEGNSTSSWKFKPLAFPYGGTVKVCGVGYQTRKAECRKKDSGIVQDKLCGSRRPPENRDCTLSCPRDCVVSKWSEWSSCDDECNKIYSDDIAVSVHVYQWRHRVVVQHRTGSGLPCPMELKQKRLCASSEKCMLFVWRSLKWSPCLTAVGSSSIYGRDDDSSNFNDAKWTCMGVMTRHIECQKISPSGDVRTVDSSYCIKFAKSPVPEGSRSCVAKCRNDYNFLDWRRKLGCQATTTVNDGDDAEEYLSNKQKDEDSIANLQKTSKPVGEWSSCNISHAQPELWKQGAKKQELHCGSGVRRRALGCFVDGTDIMVKNSYCSYRDFQEEPCEIPCPVDCVMSAWGEWGACGEINVGAQADPSVVQPLHCGKGLKMRYQFVISKPRNGGRPCPTLDSFNQRYERASCSTTCNDFFWVPDKWKTCEIKQNAAYSNCGDGLQTRSVACYKTERLSEHGNSATEVIDVRQCDISQMPYGSRRCKSACPGECVYSEWSSWSTCQSNNATTCANSKRTRERYLLRHANATSATNYCQGPSIISEEEACVLGNNCQLYKSSWSQWSSCQHTKGANCGSGQRSREQNCIGSDGLPVHTSHCAKSGLKISPTEFKDCHTACDMDCEVSQWRSWSICSATCGVTNIRKRTRTIVRNASLTGRPCPVLFETTPCPARPCYKWTLGEWSECKVSADKNCGIGTQFRDLKCYQHDGIEISGSLCKQQQGSQFDWFSSSELRRSCTKACTGECHLTDWSPWSKCHAWCSRESVVVSGLKNGVQTRSRIGFLIGQITEVDCPVSEIVERECLLSNAQCFKYEWKTGPYIRGTRKVWCERTLSPLNVSAGCLENKPQDTLFCVQNCKSINNAHCMTNGLCDCDDNYNAVRLTNGTLVACNEDHQNDQANVDKVDRFFPEDRIGLGKPNDNIPPKVTPKIEDEEVIMRSFVPLDPSNSDVATKTTSPDPITTKQVNIKKGGFFDNIEFFDENGKLLVWVYGVIAGLVVLLIFIIAMCYLIYASCCRKPRRPKYVTRNKRKKKSRKRRNHSSNSNVGIGYHDPGIRYAGTGVSFGSSRSGFSYPGHYYDSDS